MASAVLSIADPKQSEERFQYANFTLRHATLVVMFVLADVMGASQAGAQESASPSSTEEQPVPAMAAPYQAPAIADENSTLPDSPKPETDPANPDDVTSQQSRRILGVIPNYRAVSANTYWPPLNLREKFWLATQDSFDYSGFIFVAKISGFAMAKNSEPTFGQGAAGYGRYYWHSFTDNAAIGSYMTEAIERGRLYRCRAIESRRDKEKSEDTLQKRGRVKGCSEYFVSTLSHD